MAHKKYFMVFLLATLIATAGFSQVPNSVFDSSKIAAKHMTQFTNFLQNVNNFPAKPRDMWEVGVKVGSQIVNGDVPAEYSPFKSWFAGVHVRKALGHVLSLRLGYTYGVSKGLDWRVHTDVVSNPSYIPNLSTGYVGYKPTDAIYYNYRTKIQQASLDAIFNLYNIRYYKEQTGMTVYALVGVGATAFDCDINTRNDKTTYQTLWNGIALTASKKDILKKLRDGMDKTYDMHARPVGGNGTKMGKDDRWTLLPSMSIGAGIAFRLNSRFNLAIEDRLVFTHNDNVDGHMFQDRDHFALTPENDTYNQFSIGLNVNLGNKAKRVEPLYWLNPLSYPYWSLKNPPKQVIPPPDLKDADGDGVPDILDREPNTPAGARVDTHGVAMDTDGDGVPDYKDKELITPSKCQPVDADGIGNCPCPESCKQTIAPPPPPPNQVKAECASVLSNLPTVSFVAKNSTNLTAAAKKTLDIVATVVKNNPTCKLVVSGYGSSSKLEQKASWNMVNTVINYMVEQKGVSRDRFVFKYAQEGGAANVIDFRAANAGEENEPNMVNDPYPNLK